MHVKPNKSVIEGKISDLRPESDGWGANIDILVTSNLTTDADGDFIVPKKGDVITVFSTEPDNLRIGDMVKADATLLAGPFGGRNVAESIHKI